MVDQGCSRRFQVSGRGAFNNGLSDYLIVENSEKPAGAGRSRLRVACGLIALGFTLLPQAALAGVNDILKAIQASEFRFARSESQVPFYPVGWVQNNFYPRARFQDERGVLPDGEVVENTLNLGLLMPAYVAKRDMLMLGADFAWDHLHAHPNPHRRRASLRAN